MLTKALILALAVVALAVPVAAGGPDMHVKADLHSVSGSGVHGFVQIVQLPNGGSSIVVQARGLQPGEEYVSLYYDNHTCELEPYSADDVIGDVYRANPAGHGQTSGVIDDDLDEVNSVSVRRASDFQLLACADIHPGA